MGALGVEERHQNETTMLMQEEGSLEKAAHTSAQQPGQESVFSFMPSMAWALKLAWDLFVLTVITGMYLHTSSCPLGMTRLHKKSQHLPMHTRAQALCWCTVCSKSAS